MSASVCRSILMPGESPGAAWIVVSASDIQALWFLSEAELPAVRSRTSRCKIKQLFFLQHIDENSQKLQACENQQAHSKSLLQAW